MSMTIASLIKGVVKIPRLEKVAIKGVSFAMDKLIESNVLHSIHPNTCIQLQKGQISKDYIIGLQNMPPGAGAGISRRFLHFTESDP